MLRSALVAIGAIMLVAAVATIISGPATAGFLLLAWSIVLLGGTLFERFRYKRLEERRPGPGWERTTERFLDDETGEVVDVYVRPESGERLYVKE